MKIVCHENKVLYVIHLHWMKQSTCIRIAVHWFPSQGLVCSLGPSQFPLNGSRVLTWVPVPHESEHELQALHGNQTHLTAGK